MDKSGKQQIKERVEKLRAEIDQHRRLYPRTNYVLCCKKDKDLYIGSTNDLRRRFGEHNSGKIFSTKNRRPLELLYYESYKSDKDAGKREQNLKLRSRALAQLKKRIKESLK